MQGLSPMSWRRSPISAFASILAAALPAFVPQGAQARSPRNVDTVQRGVRPSAMGEAFTAVADDQNALYYNPAGLERIENWSLELLPVTVGFSSKSVQGAYDVLDIAKVAGAAFSDPTEFDAFKKSLKTITGKNYHASVGLNPNFVMRHFGFGVRMGAAVDVVPHNPAPDLIDLAFTQDMEIRFGGSYSVFEKRLKFGLALAGRQQGQLDERVSTEQLDTFTNGNPGNELKKMLKTGWGIGADAGLLFTPIEFWEPTLGLAVNNIGDLRFQPLKTPINDTPVAPPSIPQSVNLGLSLTPRWGKWFTRGAMDFRDVNLPISAGKKLRLGVEGGWGGSWISASVQTGVAEGYFTAGAELRLLLLNIRYATYVSERGYYPGQVNERRHLVGLKLLL